MLKEKLELELTKFLAIGLFLTSIVVAIGGLTDPVNVPKLLVLGIFASGSLGFLFQGNLKKVYKNQQIVILLASSFIVIALFVSIKSISPFSQNFYGSYGRNNGFIAYLFLAILYLGGTYIVNRENQGRILKSLVIAGYVNLVYCLWVIIFGDFIPWNNPYGNILGTFGNPNFIGAFLGIFFGVLIALSFDNESSRKFRISLVFLLPLTIFEIVESHAIQGRVLAALSFAIVLYFYIKSRFRFAVQAIYSTTVIALGAFALMGALQKGPLTEMIYKTSVSLRGQYWLAAWNTGKSHPMFGVGMDSFGDWYRRSRDLRAIELPGINTVVNTAHNVPLDMFAFGGWPLFIVYLLLMGLALKSAINISRLQKKYDAVAVALITAWTCYQVQSIISINQIGLAIWGWILSGLLIGYEKLLYSKPIDNSYDSTPSKYARRQHVSSNPGTVLKVSCLSLIGCMIALPPVSADIQLRTAQVSLNASKLEQTMKSNYFNPANSQKYLQNIQAFENSGLFDYSHKYALEAVKWNPESYDMWQMLSLIKKSSEEEKKTALIRMRALDPLNPELRNTK